MKLTNEQLEYALEMADIFAYKCWGSLPPSEKNSGMELDDLKQSFMCQLLNSPSDLDESQNWRGFIGVTYKNIANETLYNAFRKYRGFLNLVNEGTVEFDTSENLENPKNGVLLHESFNSDKYTREHQVEKYNEMRKLTAAITEVQALCKEFCIEYNESNPLESLIKVLEYTVGTGDTSMSESDFNLLPEAKRKRLAVLGRAACSNGIRLTLSGGKHIRRRNIGQKVREIIKDMDLRTVTATIVIKELQRLGIDHSEQTVRMLISKIKKEKGISKVQVSSPAVIRITELYDTGMVSPVEIYKVLIRERIECSKPYVYRIITKLKKEIKE